MRRSFFPRRYGVEYEVRFCLRKNHLCLLVDYFLNKILPAEALRGEAITDLKGRDQSLLLLTDTPAPLRPHGEELVLVAGYIVESDDTDLSVTTHLPFELEIQSRFKEFVGRRHILHDVEVMRKGEFPLFLEPRNIGRTFPLRIERFRIGLERFTTKDGARIFGVIPTLTETLLLECHGEEAALRVSAELLPSRKTFPFAKNGEFERLARFVGTISSFDPLQDYLERVSER